MSGIRIFELVDVLLAGGSARARLLKWTGQRYTPSAFALVTVHDFIGERGRPGDRGYCYLSEDSHRWEVLGSLPDRTLVPERGSAEEHADEHEELRRPLFPALGHASHDDWPTSTLM